MATEHPISFIEKVEELMGRGKLLKQSAGLEALVGNLDGLDLRLMSITRTLPKDQVRPATIVIDDGCGTKIELMCMNRMCLNAVETD